MERVGVATVKVSDKVAPKNSLRLLYIVKIGRVRSIIGNKFHRWEILANNHMMGEGTIVDL